MRRRRAIRVLTLACLALACLPAGAGAVVVVPGQVQVPIPGNNWADTSGEVRFVVAPNGRLVVATNVGDRWYVARLLANGRLDRTFSRDGKLVVRRWARRRGGAGVTVDALDVDRFGRIVVAGHTPLGLTVLRLTSRGGIDRRFGGGDGMYTHARWRVDDIDLDHAGRVVLTGTGWREGVLTLRLTGRGALDRSFSGNGFVIERYYSDATVKGGNGLGASGSSVVVGRDGRITVGGGIYRGIASQDTALLHRYDRYGSPADGFVATEHQYDFSDPEGPTSAAIAVAADGSIWNTGQLGRTVMVAHHTADGRVNHRVSMATGVGGSTGWAGQVDAAGRFVTVGARGQKTYVARHRLDDDEMVVIDRSLAGDGRYDFGARGFSAYRATQVELDARGRILVAGLAERRSFRAADWIVVTRLFGNGRLDRSLRTRG